VSRLHPRARVHAERPEEALGHDVLDPAAGGPFDHASEHGEPEVGVLVRSAGGLAERAPAGDDPVELLIGEIEVAVGPRIVGHQSARHREEVAHGDRWGVGGWGAERVERGVVSPDRVVQAQQPIVAEQQRRRRGERLGHRCDPVDGVLVGGGTLRARRTSQRQDAIADHSPGDRGAVVLLGVPGDEVVQRGAIDRHSISLAARA
jgi:hypothetical protein